MSYLSLARKYRPQTFDEIVGQEHITTTLKNAIAMEHVAHAYLFTGPRGVGKTSTARILAKSLNCEKGSTPTPCGICLSCSEISEGKNMDVLEIDGASNRGIDEVRNLRENIKFTPLRGKFRIYIIDEVHMLTPEAFNALLKTLEEPPLHVKFIFATTKPYKVLPTVISRCQRFDFRRIAVHDIVARLKEIREKEKLDIAEEAIFLIAKAADGSLRDAEVILDQLLAFTRGRINSADVVKALGLLHMDILFEIADSIINGDKERILGLINNLVASGKDPIFITSELITHFRNILVASIMKEKDTSYLTIPLEEYHRLKEQSRKLSKNEILYIIYTLSTTIELIKKTTLGRIPLETSLVKLADGRKIVSVEEILRRLSDLERNISEQPEIQESMKPPSTPPGIPENKITEERDILLFQKIKSSWNKILNLIKAKKMSVATFLAEGTLLRVKDNTLAIGFDKSNSLHKEAIEETANKTLVEEAIESVVEEHIRLQVETVEYQTAEETALIEGADENIVEQGINEAVEELDKIDPIIESALDIFDGKVVDIRKAGKREEKPEKREIR